MEQGIHGLGGAYPDHVQERPHQADRPAPVLHVALRRGDLVKRDAQVLQGQRRVDGHVQPGSVEAVRVAVSASVDRYPVR